MKNNEAKIKEQRTIEATHKDYFGLGGKFGCILKHMGEPIMSHSSPLYDVTEMEDPWALEGEKDEEIPIFDEEEQTLVVGYIFDGLNRGMHLEIKYINKVMTVLAEGYLVFQEERGELMCYVPHSKWENQIEDLFKTASKLRNKDKKDSRKKREEQAIKARDKWFSRMAKKWGFK